MVDVSSIKQYFIELDKVQIKFIVNEIEIVGLDSFLTYNFTTLDCSRVNKQGFKLMQTIGYPYMHVISQTLYVIKNFVEKDKQDEYLIKLLEIHNKNVEYEKINPPMWYGGDKAKNKFEKQYKTKSKTKQTKEKGPSKAELKLAAKVAKINALTFKIKQV